MIRQESLKRSTPSAIVCQLTPRPPPSFRTEQADFFFPFCSCKTVGLRREKSLFSLISPTGPPRSLVRDSETVTIGCRDENRSATGAASHVAGAEIAGVRTPISFRLATKGGCLARATSGLDRRSHPSGRSQDFLVCPRLISF